LIITITQDIVTALKICREMSPASLKAGMILFKQNPSWCH